MYDTFKVVDAQADLIASCLWTALNNGTYCAHILEGFCHLDCMYVTSQNQKPLIALHELTMLLRYHVASHSVTSYDRSSSRDTG